MLHKSLPGFLDTCPEASVQYVPSLIGAQTVTIGLSLPQVNGSLLTLTVNKLIFGYHSISFCNTLSIFFDFSVAFPSSLFLKKEVLG